MLNGHNDANTKAYLLALQAGHKPDSKPDIPEHWQEVVKAVEWDYTRSGGDGQIFRELLASRCQSMPELAELLAEQPEKPVKPRKKRKSTEVHQTPTITGETLPLQGGNGQTEQQPFNCTDLGNAERFAQRWRGEICWCEAWNSWMIFNGKCWGKDTTKAVLKAAKTVVRAIYHEAADEPDAERRTTLAKHAVRSEEAKHVNALLALAKAELPVRPEQFNRQLHLMNCSNGTVNLKTGELQPHKASDMLTRCIKTAYHPQATRPITDPFLSWMFEGNTALIEFFQTALGMSLSGDTREQSWFLCVGEGNNGKSTILETVGRILMDYWHSAKIETFLVKKDEKTHDIAEFYGKRLITTSELKPGSRLNEAFMKRLTGGEDLRAERKYEHEFQFTPECTVWMSVNHKPVVKDTSRGMWRRVKYIPFNVSLPDSQVDTELPAKLLAEAEGILAWLIAGCVRWYEQGRLQIPEIVREATRVYQQEQDVSAQFIAEECDMDKDGKVLTRALNARYEQWCEQKQEKPDTAALKEALNKLGLHSKRSTGGKWRYEGIALKPADELPLFKDDAAKSDGKVTVSDGSDGSDGESIKSHARELARENLGKTMSLPSLPSLFELETTQNSDGTVTILEKSLQKNGKTTVTQAFNEGIELADLLLEVQKTYKKRENQGIFRQMWHAPGEPIRQLTASDYRARVEQAIESGNNERIQSARVAMLRTLGRYEEE